MRAGGRVCARVVRGDVEVCHISRFLHRHTVMYVTTSPSNVMTLTPTKTHSTGSGWGGNCREEESLECWEGRVC